MKSSVIALLLFLVGCVAHGVPREEHARSIALVDQGTIQMRRGDLEQAERSFSLAYEIGHLAQGLDGLGCIAFLRSEFNLAESYFNAAYNMDVTYDNPLANLALLYDVTGRKEEARRLYSKFIALQPLNVRNRSNFGAFIADSLSGDMESARREILGAQSLGNHPIIEENLRRLEMQNGKSSGS